MAGRKKAAKKKRAKEKKQQVEQQNRDMKPRKIIRPAKQKKTLADLIVEAALADQPEPEELGNNAEPLPLTADTVNEDAQEDATTIVDQIVDAENKLAIPELEKPFDPMSVVNEILMHQNNEAELRKIVEKEDVDDG